jgi:DNA-binding transcriptional regulator YdaS (Cro superfamily)
MRVKDIGLLAAIDAAGSPTALARLLGITKQAVFSWERVPYERARAVQDATGIPLHDLRPDIWPAPNGKEHTND